MTEFRLTEDHLKLLRRANIGWESCEYGAPAMDCKRPYGNSNVEDDICRIIGWCPLDEATEDWSREQRDRASQLHQDLQIALQLLVIYAGSKLKTGLYRMTKDYDCHSWIWVKP